MYPEYKVRCFNVLQAQSDDDDAGDDVAVTVDPSGFMEKFFEQVNS